MENYIIIAIIVLIIGGILFYLFRSKKRGDTCVGCPYAKQCGSKGCGCNSQKQNGFKDK